MRTQTQARTRRVFVVDTTDMDDDTVREMTAHVADAVTDFGDLVSVEDEGDE